MSLSAKRIHLIAHTMKASMVKLLKRFRPDFLICAHPFPCAAVSHLKEKVHLAIPLAAVITDFAVHRLWILRQVELYVVAAEEMGRESMKNGVPSRDIHVSGIPISLLFSAVYSENVVRKKMHLQEQLPIMGVMGGGLGLGGFERILTDLNKVSVPMQSGFIVGRNQALQKSLSQIADTSRHFVYVWGL